MIEEKVLPLVSVVIPCYNHENFIKEAIVSIVNQTYQNIELIIIDDGSKDGSVDVIKQMLSACEERFVRFEFRHRANKGLSATLNEGLSWCKGEFFTACSSDDFFSKDKISSQISFLKKNQQTKYCISLATVVDEFSKIIETETQIYNKGIEDKNISFENIFLVKIHLPITGMFIMNFIKKELRGYDEFCFAEDFDFNLKIVNLTKIGIINRELYSYRSPNIMASKNLRLPMKIEASESHLNTINKYKDHILYNQAMIEWNFRRFIYYSSYSKLKLYAIKGMFKSIKKINNVLFFKAFIRLIIYWKTYK